MDTPFHVIAHAHTHSHTQLRHVLQLLGIQHLAPTQVIMCICGCLGEVHCLCDLCQFILTHTHTHTTHTYYTLKHTHTHTTHSHSHKYYTHTHTHTNHSRTHQPHTLTHTQPRPPLMGHRDYVSADLLIHWNSYSRVLPEGGGPPIHIRLGLVCCVLCVCVCVCLVYE
jgi:hypothetical protein